MKFAVDCRFFEKSGIGTYIENIVDELVENHPENEYLIIVDKKIPKYQGKEYIKMLVTKIKPFSFMELVSFPLQEINQCDAFFSPYINIPGRIRVPVFSTIHDVIFWDVPELSSPFGRWIRSLFVRRAIKMSTSLFTVSNYSKERICYHFKTSKRIIVVHNSIARKLKEYPIKCEEKENTIVFVGNIKEHKGLKVLLEAYHKAKELGCKDKMVIIGNGDNFRTKDKMVMDLLENQDDIVFTGFLPDEQMYKTISHAKVLVLPSKYEGFGIPPMEALYLGTNTIVSDIPVLKEIYGELPVTFFKSCDVNDLKDKLLEDYPKLDIYDVRKQIDEKYNINNQVNLLLNVIKSNIS